jgi:AcrR family transcriptional regulator
MGLNRAGLNRVAVAELDGRRVRRRQNREAVIDALIDLFHEDIYEPGSALIAERAGLSPRSLFRYFDDIDDLSHAAINRELSEALPLVQIDVEPRAPLPVRIQRLVESRVRVYEAIGPGARAARILAHRNAVVAKQVHDARHYLREQIRQLFGDAPNLTAVDALCSFETYELLRDQRLSRPKIVAILVDSLTALL